MKKETDSDYAKTIEDIIEEIADKYVISVDKRTIQRYIKMLKDCGYNIVSEEYDKSNYHQKAYFIKEDNNEAFSVAEVRYIIDAILFSKHINKKMAKHIINQFRELYSNPFVESLKYINELKPDNESKHINSQNMFFNIEEIHNAIRRKQKIKIWFVEYDEIKGKLNEDIKKNETTQETYELYQFYMIPF